MSLVINSSIGKSFGTITVFLGVRLVGEDENGTQYRVFYHPRGGSTNVEPVFDNGEFTKWLRDHQNIPELTLGGELSRWNRSEKIGKRGIVIVERAYALYLASRMPKEDPK